MPTDQRFIGSDFAQTKSTKSVFNIIKYKKERPCGRSLWLLSLMFINFILAEVSLEQSLEDSAVTSFVAIDFSII